MARERGRGTPPGRAIVVVGIVRREGDDLVVTATISREEADRLHLREGETVAVEVRAVGERGQATREGNLLPTDLHPVVRATAGLLRRRGTEVTPLDQLLDRARDERAEQLLREG
jgi:hypothetical protein